jgi:hypothetical protein
LIQINVRAWHIEIAFAMNGATGDPDTMPKDSPIFLLLIGTALLSTAVPAVGDSFAGTYAGKRVLTKGDNTCPTEDNVSVTVKDGTLTFTNSALKHFAIGFDPRPDGSFGAIYQDVGGDAVTIRGRIVGNTLDADVTNGSCKHHWHLQKPS